MRRVYGTRRTRSIVGAKLGRTVLVGGCLLALFWLAYAIHTFPLPERAMQRMISGGSPLTGVDRLVMDNITAREWTEGAANWSIEAATSVFLESAGEISFQRVRLTVSEPPVGHIEVSGERGRAKVLGTGEKTPRFRVQDVEIHGGVVAEATGGIRVETQRMVWDSSTGGFWFPEEALIYRAGRCFVAQDGHLYRDGRFEGKNVHPCPTAREGE